MLYERAPQAPFWHLRASFLRASFRIVYEKGLPTSLGSTVGSLLSGPSPFRLAGTFPDDPCSRLLRVIPEILLLNWPYVATARNNVQ